MLCSRTCTIGVGVCVIWGGWASGVGTTDEESRVSVELLADRRAAEPGRTVNLALRFKTPDEYHLFWRHPGDAGGAPAVTWTSPSGAEFGPLRFPVPDKRRTESGEETNILTGQPVLLTMLTVPKDAKPGGSLTIRGRVEWMAAQSEPHPGSGIVELHLPIVPLGHGGAPANEEVFEDVRYSMPVPAGKAKYVKVRTELKPAEALPGGRATARIAVTVARGFHIQAHKPGVEGLIGAELFVDPPKGVSVGRTDFPKGKARKVKFLGTVREYGGQFTFEVPLTFSADFAAPATLTGLLRYQACNDKTGMCFPPEHVEWSLPLKTTK